MDAMQAFGVLILLIAVGYGGRRFFRVYNDERLARDWADIQAIVGGRFEREKSERWLVGQYKGRQIRVRCNSLEQDDNHHRFIIELISLPGSSDWKIMYQTAFVVFGYGKWLVESKNVTFQEDLVKSGLLECIGELATPAAILGYSQPKQMLSYEDFLKKPKPSRERFLASLDIVIRLADIHEKVNSPEAL